MPSRHPPPWQLSPALPPLHPQHILVLGEPPATELLPLLTSPHLANSLVLLATHAPPLLPAHALSAPGPAVRILRLRGPLAVHDAGALRLVSLLERAQRAAARWAALEAPDAPALKSASRSRTARNAPPTRPPPPRIAQYAEDPKTGEFLVPEPVLCSASRRPHAVSGSSPSAPPSAPASVPISASGSTASLPATATMSVNITPLAYPTPAHSREGSHTRLPLDDPSLGMPSFSSRPASFHAGMPAPFSPSSSFAGSLASTAGPGFPSGPNTNGAATPSRARALARRASTVLSSSASSLLDGLFSSPLSGTAEEAWAHAILSEADLDRLVRPFDTLVNFLPAGGAPDKALLKHAVLVTTLGARFLEPFPGKPGKAGARVDREHFKAEKEREREQVRIEKERERRASSALGMTSTSTSRRASWRFSVFSFASLASASASAHENSANEHGQSQSHQDGFSVPKDTSSHEQAQAQDVEPHVPRAHIIHVLPATRHHHHVYGSAHEERKLARSIEQFLLAFAGAGAGAGMGAGTARPHLTQPHPVQSRSSANEQEQEVVSSSSSSANANPNAPPSAYRRTTGTGLRRPPPSAYPAGRHRRLDGASVGGPSSSSSSSSGASGSGSGAGVNGTSANTSASASGEEIELEHRTSKVLDLDSARLEDGSGNGSGADKRASTYSAFSAFSAFWSSGAKESEGMGTGTGKRASVYAPPVEQVQDQQVQGEQRVHGEQQGRSHGHHHHQRHTSTGPVPYLVAPGVFGAPVRGGGAVKVMSSTSVPASASVSRSMSSASVSALSTSFSSSALSASLSLSSSVGGLTTPPLSSGLSSTPESSIGGVGSASASTSANANAPVRPLSTGEALVLGALDAAASSSAFGLSEARRAWVGPGDVAVRHESTGSQRASGSASGRAGGRNEEEAEEGGRSSDEGERERERGKNASSRKERYGERPVGKVQSARKPGMPTPPPGSGSGSTEGEGEGEGDVSGNGESASESEWEGVVMRKSGAGEKGKALVKAEAETVAKAEPGEKAKAVDEEKEKEKEVKFEGLPTPPMSGAATPVEERASPVRELLAVHEVDAQEIESAKADEDRDKMALARRSLPPPPLPAKDGNNKPNALSDNLIAGDLDSLLQPLSLSLALSMPSSDPAHTHAPVTMITPSCSDSIVPAHAPSTPMTPSTPIPSTPMTLDAHASDAHLPLSLPYVLGTDRAMAASTPALVPSSSSLSASSSSAAAAAAAAVFGVDGGSGVGGGVKTDAGVHASANADKARGGGEGKVKGRARRLGALQSAIKRFAVWRGKEKEKEAVKVL